MLTLLILGGFMVLALLFGGSAQAASGPDSAKTGTSGPDAGLLGSEKPSGSRTPGQAADGEHHMSKAELAERRREARQAARRTASQVIAPVAESLERTGQVTRPVGDTVEGVTDAVDLRGLSGQLGPELGDRGDGASEDHSAHVPGRGAGDDSSARTDDGAASGLNAPHTQVGSHSAPGISSHSAGWHTTADNGTSRDNGGLPGQVPFHQVPAAPATTTSHHASDGNGPRGADAHQLAGYMTDVEHFGLLQPGAVRAAAGTPTRDRASEILEFPG
ncbi:MAG TPA: hypothetical protein VNS49_04670 [Streptomyces sp.]|nr:hypothetical protein [Streptomyces sp.]